MRVASVIWRLARILFGLFFIYAPVMVLVRHGGRNPPETVRAAEDFVRALDRTGFMNPLIMITMAIGGLAMLFHRTAPLGLVVLGPNVAVIVLFHWVLSGNIVWGTVWGLWFLALTWRYRAALYRLAEPMNPAEGAR